MTVAENKFNYLSQPITIAFMLSAAKILLYIIAGANYGYFRDELYFLACADHLAWGYPDHAPLSIFLTWFSRAIFGDSLYAIHLFPALAGALKIIITGIIVREFGGRYIAMFLACLGVLVTPIYLGVDLLLSMNVYEPIFWMGCVLSYIWAVRRGDPRYWMLFGAFAGLGLMNKHSMLFFGAAFVVGLITTRDRRFLAEPYLWIGGLIACLIFLPNIIWQYENNWATLELLRNVQETGKNVVLGPLEFFWQQMFILLPFTVPIWFAGIWYFFADRDGKRFRTLGVTYVVTLLLMILLKAKNYYLAPIYPMLFAAGGVLLDKALSSLRYGRLAAISYGVLLVTFGLIFLPLAVPVLPVEVLIAYQEKIGVAPPKTEIGHSGPLPQHFGDRFGWEEMTSKVATVYNSLSTDERRNAAIFADNYGEAGAIDHFGKSYGLPKAISGHQSYFMWGPGDSDGSLIILLGSEKEDAEKNCVDVEERDLVEHPYAMSEERFHILICRGLRTPLPILWNELKHWN